MPGVWKGFLSIQNSCCPQNITHAGQGAQTSQDKVRAFASINGDTIKQNLVPPAKNIVIARPRRLHLRAVDLCARLRAPKMD